MSNCLWPHGLQHTRPPCPSPLPELAQTHAHRVGDAIQPSHPLSNSPALNLSQHQCLFWVSSSHQVAKLLELQLQHLSFQWIFRTDLGPWDGLVWAPCSPRDSRVFSNTIVQKASILQHSAFFMIQLSHPYMTTGKTIALTIQISVSKLMSLLFNMLPRLIIAFLPRSNHLLTSCLQSASPVIFKPKEKKSLSLFPLFPHLFAMKL